MRLQFKNKDLNPGPLESKASACATNDLRWPHFILFYFVLLLYITSSELNTFANSAICLKICSVTGAAIPSIEQAPGIVQLIVAVTISDPGWLRGRANLRCFTLKNNCFFVYVLNIGLKDFSGVFLICLSTYYL